MESKSESILAAARAQVSQMLAKTEQEIAAMTQAAKKSGQEQGYAQAAHLKDKIKTYEEALLVEVESEILRASLDVAATLIQAQLKSNPESIIKLVQAVLATMPDVTRLRLRANPTDVEMLEANKSTLLDGLGRVTEFDIKGDKQVEQGGVIIHTESGVIDAQPKTQLDEISRILKI